MNKFEEFYYSVHDKVMPDMNKAKLVVSQGDKGWGDGYSSEKERIEIHLSDTEYETDTPADASSKYSVWQSMLMHQLIHEYQDKMNLHPDESAELCTLRNTKMLLGEKHAAGFYQALINVAHIVGDAPIDLLGEI